MSIREFTYEICFSIDFFFKIVRVVYHIISKWFPPFQYPFIALLSLLQFALSEHWIIGMTRILLFAITFGVKSTLAGWLNKAFQPGLWVSTYLHLCFPALFLPRTTSRPVRSASWRHTLILLQPWTPPFSFTTYFNTRTLRHAQSRLFLLFLHPSA